MSKTHLDILSQTSLELIVDNRSGSKLEIVFPTFNEQVRIANLLTLYSSDFDIVIMDGGSTDNTCKLVEKSGGTVYRRVGDGVGENHYVFYVNKLCKSGRCFYMMCDEYAELIDLHKASDFLLLQGAQVLGRRIDSFYGDQARKATCVAPKGFRKGDAVYNPKIYHNTLFYKKMSTKRLTIDVLHLHVNSIKADYGKYGYYIYYEMVQLLTYDFTTKVIFIHILKLVRSLQLNVSRYPLSARRTLFFTAQFLVFSLLLAMAYIELKWFKSPDDQRKLYLAKYQ